jgi:hypothetical protein
MSMCIPTTRVTTSFAHGRSADLTSRSKTSTSSLQRGIALRHLVKAQIETIPTGATQAAETDRGAEEGAAGWEACPSDTREGDADLCLPRRRRGVAMQEGKSRSREGHDDDLAYVRKGDAGLGLDYMSVHWSVNRLASNLVDLGSLIAKRLRERVANRHRPV